MRNYYADLGVKIPFLRDGELNTAENIRKACDKVDLDAVASKALLHGQLSDSSGGVADEAGQEQYEQALAFLVKPAQRAELDKELAAKPFAFISNDAFVSLVNADLISENDVASIKQDEIQTRVFLRLGNDLNHNGGLTPDELTAKEAQVMLVKEFFNSQYYKDMQQTVFQAIDGKLGGLSNEDKTKVFKLGINEIKREIVEAALTAEKKEDFGHMNQRIQNHLESVTNNDNIAEHDSLLWKVLKWVAATIVTIVSFGAPFWSKSLNSFFFDSPEQRVARRAQWSVQYNKEAPEGDSQGKDANLAGLAKVAEELSVNPKVDEPDLEDQADPNAP